MTDVKVKKIFYGDSMYLVKVIDLIEPLPQPLALIARKLKLELNGEVSTWQIEVETYMKPDLQGS